MSHKTGVKIGRSQWPGGMMLDQGWTSKLITKGKEVPRIEIRGATTGKQLSRGREINTYAQILVVVFAEDFRISMNGTANFSYKDFMQLHIEIQDARMRLIRWTSENSDKEHE